MYITSEPEPATPAESLGLSRLARGRHYCHSSLQLFDLRLAMPQQPAYCSPAACAAGQVLRRRC